MNELIFTSILGFLVPRDPETDLAILTVSVWPACESGSTREMAVYPPQCLLTRLIHSRGLMSLDNNKSTLWTKSISHEIFSHGTYSAASFYWKTVDCNNLFIIVLHLRIQVCAGEEAWWVDIKAHLILHQGAVLNGLLTSELWWTLWWCSGCVPSHRLLHLRAVFICHQHSQNTLHDDMK